MFDWLCWWQWHWPFLWSFSRYINFPGSLVVNKIQFLSSSCWLIVDSAALSFFRSAVPSCSFCSLKRPSAGCVTSPSPCASSFSSIFSLSSCPTFAISSASLVSQICSVEDLLVTLICRIQLIHFSFRCHICSQPHFHIARNILHLHHPQRAGAVEIPAKDPGENQTESYFTLTDPWLLFFSLHLCFAGDDLCDTGFHLHDYEYYVHHNTVGHWKEVDGSTLTELREHNWILKTKYRTHRPEPATSDPGSVSFSLINILSDNSSIYISQKLKGFQGAQLPKNWLQIFLTCYSHDALITFLLKDIFTCKDIAVMTGKWNFLNYMDGKTVKLWWEFTHLNCQKCKHAVWSLPPTKQSNFTVTETVCVFLFWSYFGIQKSFISENALFRSLQIILLA